MLQLEPISGTVRPGPENRVTCRMTFTPSASDDSAVLDGIRLPCTIAGARRYVLALRGSGMPRKPEPDPEQLLLVTSTLEPGELETISAADSRCVALPPTGVAPSL